MTELRASRTLVKSPPELWAECSDAASLARHLGQFGEIRITRLEPETTVAWEGDRARGTVHIEPAGWGTKVILTAVAHSVPHGEAVASPGEAPPAEGPTTSAEEPIASAEEPIASAEEPAPSPEEPAPSPEEATPPARVEEAPPPRPRRFARLLAFLRGPEPPAEDSPEPMDVETPPEPLDVETPPEPLDVEIPPEPMDLEAPPAPADPEPPPPFGADPPAREAPESDAEAALAAALDSLGQAHHRPFSRA